MKPRTLLDLAPPQTWQALVALPIPGKAGAVEFTFRTRTRDELKAFVDALPGMTDEQALGAVLAGWALADKFNADNIAALCQAVPGAAHAIVQAYMRHQTGLRE